MNGPRYYQHSGNFSLVFLVFGTVLAAILGLFVAWAYAYAIYYIPFIYINVILTAAFGFALAIINTQVLKGAKVRNETVFTLVGILLVSLAFYGHWAAWVGIALRASAVDVMGIDVAMQPAALWGTMLDINGTGLWSIFGLDFSGWLLWVVWGLEAAMILGIGLLGAAGMFSDVPFCEKCETWCTKHGNVARVWHSDGQQVTTAFENLDLETLRSFQAVPLGAESGQWFECDVETCGSCGATNTLDVSLVKAEKTEKGDESKDTSPVISNLLLTTENVEAIRSLGASTA